MSSAALRKERTDVRPAKEQRTQKGSNTTSGLKVESFDMNEALRLAIRNNLRIAKNAAIKKAR